MMYHAIKISTIDQNTHRFQWRNLKLNREPDTFVITSVSFGDKPAGSIAITALRKTAELGKKEYPDAAAIILKNVYMDDIIDSFNSYEKALSMSREVDSLLLPGGFHIRFEISYSYLGGDALHRPAFVTPSLLSAVYELVILYN